MIAYLRGNLLEKSANSVIIETGGVGYEVWIPLSTFYEIGEVGTEAELRIHTHVREDALQLFGFRTENEKAIFLLLTSVQGIGPRSAIAMLSGMNADEFAAAVRANDLARLTAIPGIGRKTAERLVIELRDKLSNIGTAAAASSSGGTASASDFDDALSALVNLGYQRAAAEKALDKAAAEGTEQNVQKLLRRSLQILAK
ncbi:MAG: Holliday junction branch migration protein RuvA [Acidobacteriota bacterium]|nr:MAG: Holliday junction branch migration protein RuvA [Acidobacteriota bacterium]